MTAGELDARIDRLVQILRSTGFRFANERQLQDGIETLFLRTGEEYAREASLDRVRDRPDFLVCGGRVALEVKCQGSPGLVQAQLLRYAKHEGIAALVLLTSRWQAANMPATLAGKPLRVVNIAGTRL